MKRQSISPEEVPAKIEEVYAFVDNRRQEELQRAVRINRIQHDALLRERARLSKKYSVSHPRIQKINARITESQRLAKALDHELELAHIEMPVPGPDLWHIHGRVWSSKGERMSGLTVSLYEKAGGWIRAMGFACTNEHGYFLLTVSDKSGEIGEKYQDTELILTVLNDKKEILSQEKDPLKLALGRIDFREIMMKGKGCKAPS